MKWLAGWTDPGGFPETESKEFAADQYAAARAFLAEEISFLADCAYFLADCPSYLDECEYLNDLSAEYKRFGSVVWAQTGSFSLTGPDGRVYWIESGEGK